MIDWTKPVETDEENPRPVRVLCTDCKGLYPVVLAVSSLNNSDGLNDSVIIERRPLSGLGSPAIRNVRPKPVKYSGWVNIGRSSDGTRSPYGQVWHFEGDAKRCKSEGIGHLEYVATIRIEWEEFPHD